MKTTLRRLCFAMVLCACMAVLAGCGKHETDRTRVKSVPVGAVLPLTGAGSAAGAYVRDSLAFAAQLPQVADAGGAPPVRVIVADSKSNPRDAIAAYRQLLSANSGIRVLFVQMSSVASALAPVAKEDGVVVISISSTEGPITSNPYFIVNYLDAATQARLYLGHLDSNTPLTVYYLNDEYGRSVEVATRDIAAGRRVSSYPFALDSSARDIIASSLPKAGEVVIVGYGGKMAELARELDVLGFQGDILCSAELLIAPNLDAVRHIKAPIWAVEMRPLPRLMLESFKQRMGREATGADALALNGMLIVASAYRDRPAKSDLRSPQEILRSLEERAASGVAPGVSRLANQRFIYNASLTRINP